MLDPVKRWLRCALRAISPRLDYWVMSVYHAIRAPLFLLRHPKLVRTGPRIVLVAGEDGPDKLHVNAPVYSVYETLRPYFDVELSVHASFTEAHVRQIAETDPDLVLLSAGIGTWHHLFKQYGVPLMGSSARTTGLCYDKQAAKEAVLRLGIATPAWGVVRKGESLQGIFEHLRFPLVAKPRRGGSSEGVSKARSRKDLPRAIARALRWDTEVLIEEYASGKEYTCTVYGNENPKTLPLDRKIMPFEREKLEATGKRVQESRFPFESDEPFVELIHTRSIDIYTALQCRDMIRIDWKSDHAAQVLSFLDVSTLPWIGRAGGNIDECARAAGSSYDEFILQLFRESLRRHGRS
jgi:D-alanine-D-alanine ligase